ncbi:MAG: type II toxin-antitoxin system Phd/YefM family antitoxin [Clostridiales Family XIII bacterium]|jgi:PHD/YefM family antitoxin component YafN of YafNO toxin-antitoxin module|nr:type II toxin-antitoxin system Phd/YefM family antitoxin [Clostridiales Family XIII bacterium]
MQFVTVRDFRSSSREIWDKLSRDDEIIVTNNGKPTALLLNVSENNFEETLRLIRQAKVLRIVGDMREEAGERGFLNDEEIDAEIQAYRDEKRKNAK